jgi:hypothetical protein
MHDVFTTGVSTSLPLVYNAASSGWVAQALTSVGIDAGAVNTSKLSSGAAAASTVLTADGAGNASFQPASGGGFTPLFLTGV